MASTSCSPGRPDFWSHRLDRGRPLWRTVLLEGLAGGRWALVTQAHHCLVDGVGSVDAGSVLLDAEPKPARPQGGAADAPGPASPLTPGAPAAPGQAAADRGPGAAVDVVRHPRHAAEGLDSARALVELLGVRDKLVAAPSTSLNVPLSEHRRDRRDRGPAGGDQGDQACPGRHRQRRRPRARHRGAARSAESRAARRRLPPVCERWCPSTSAPRRSRSKLGNRITSLFVHLPVSVAEPRARYRRVRAETMRLKASHQAAGSRLLIEMAGMAPPVLHSVLAQALFATRLFNVTVTNVPASPSTMYAFGAPLRRIIPLVPLAAEHAVGIAALSYADTVCFCVHADRDAVPDVERIAAGIDAELQALSGVAGKAAAAAATRSGPALTRCGRAAGAQRSSAAMTLPVRRVRTPPPRGEQPLRLVGEADAERAGHAGQLLGMAERAAGGGGKRRPGQRASPKAADRAPRDGGRARGVRSPGHRGWRVRSHPR